VFKCFHRGTIRGCFDVALPCWPLAQAKGVSDCEMGRDGLALSQRTAKVYARDLEGGVRVGGERVGLGWWLEQLWVLRLDGRMDRCG